MPVSQSTTGNRQRSYQALGMKTPTEAHAFSV